MFVSFFCIATEPFKNKYPILESIKSVLPLADEVIVILGRDEKSSTKLIKGLDKKVKVFKTDLWHKDWSYDVMTYHFDYGFKKCRGDFCVKFDIDYIFKYSDEFKLENIFKKKLAFHKVYLPKYNYLDNSHWMIFKRGIYCINKKLIMKEHNNDQDSFFIGNRNYVNELIINKPIREYVYDGPDIKVFNYDCSFMDKNLFYEKQFRWYNAYYKKWGNLKHFGLREEILKDKEKLIKFHIERTKERIQHAAKHNNIHFDSIKFNPALIRTKLRELSYKEYGFNYFGIFKLSNILYDKLPNKKQVLLKNMERIKKYFNKLEGEHEFLKGENDEEMVNIIMKNLGDKTLKISKFL